MSIMNKRDQKIVEAALQVFMRYGIRRTTMNDIATEAGLVRQTVYTAYANKDEVLCATIRYFSEKSQTAIEADWEGADNLGDKLDVYFEHAIVSSFAMIKASPEAEDMVDGYNAAGKAEIRRVQVHKRKALAGILKPYKSGITSAGFIRRVLSIKAPDGNLSWSSIRNRSTVVSGSPVSRLVIRIPATGARMGTERTDALPPMALASNTRAATVSTKDSVARISRLVRVLRQL